MSTRSPCIRKSDSTASRHDAAGGESIGLTDFWREWLAYHAPRAERAHAFHQALAQGFADLAIQQAKLHCIQKWCCLVVCSITNYYVIY